MPATRRRAQIVPLLAVFMVAYIGIAGLVIDGGFLLQTQRDITTIARAAGLAGATQIDWGAYAASCGVGADTMGNGCVYPPLSAKAEDVARATAQRWLDPTGNPFLVRSGTTGAPVQVTRPSPWSIRVTVRRCLRLLLVGIVMRGVKCSGIDGLEVSASYTATATLGN